MDIRLAEPKSGHSAKQGQKVPKYGHLAVAKKLTGPKFSWQEVAINSSLPAYASWKF